MTEIQTREARTPAARASEASERAQAVRALETEFGELIARFRRLLTDAAHRVNPGMLPGAYKVFTTIVRREHTTTSALAEALVMDKGQVSRTIRELEGLGLIERVPDPKDGRSSIVSPTQEGLDRLAAARLPQEDGLAHALQGWQVADIRELTRLMHALVNEEPPAL
ncbi:MarR family winged helix-turn-helix transcriptional regulator [Microbacterium sp. ASV49]|uniref:MarR family winged helix-turn-helix transcriptional regulator n=1 Tax=Microbacterium candidum TaxID=3041922 RepID=A0ABT7N3V0_9MICO|nr:MarR family winged helix-turn-helix transcriptional regulator [Microbacterium sp. ASV49]MDL9981346.1 MarR family winged helix-turn-helix transcriptional regulator [Microbacterium sp. ASV49]